MRTRDKLENMLIDKGLNVDLLWGAMGQWRKACMDVYRWEAQCRRSDNSLVHIGSYNTMTECVRRGFTLEQDKVDHFMEAHANVKKEAKGVPSEQAQTAKI